MLNTLWSADDISVKEELKEDVLTSPDSPFHCSPDQAPSSPLLRGLTEYHKLSPAPAPDSTQSHYYLTSVDSDNNHLGALLPAFHNLQPEPESPESRLTGAIEFPALGLTELSSPDSSQPPYPGLSTAHSLSLTSSTRTQGPASRKRSNSGSSGSSAHSGSCSAGSGQSRPKIRRRQPLSQEELNTQRNQANVRERQRTQSLNDAFTKLREIVPTQPSDKLSKRETLKLAHMYIDFLNEVLERQDNYDNGNVDYLAHSREDFIQAFNIWRMTQQHAN